IISVATTLPEFFVSTIASSDGFSDMAVGNSIGSIICNIALILAITTFIKPIEIKDSSFDSKGIMMLIYISIFFHMASDGLISKLEGIVLVSLTIFFILINIIGQDSNRPKKRIRKYNFKNELTTNILKFLIGGGLMILGADLLVETGVEIAYFFRIPKQIISLTLLAFGTSIPELTASVAAIKKGKDDIVSGNIIGANILNICIVLGGSALVSSNGLVISKQTLVLDIPVAILFMLIFILPGILRRKIGRFSGALLGILYIVYLKILF